LSRLVRKSDKKSKLSLKVKEDSWRDNFMRVMLLTLCMYSIHLNLGEDGKYFIGPLPPLLLFSKIIFKSF